MTEVRVIGGFIEQDYLKLAEILPGIDERDVRDALTGLSEDAESEAYDEGYKDGRGETGDAVSEAISDFNDNIDSFIDKLLKNGTITKDQHETICEGMPDE